MPFNFDVPQQTQIEAFHTQGVMNAATPGAFSPMYNYINNVLITGNPPPTNNLEVKRAQLWFSGATQANSNIGPYAIVIREYTQNQQRLHLGRPAPLGLGPGGLQLASNEVAQRVKSDIQTGGVLVPPRPPWSLPTITEIGNNDALAVGQILFNIQGSSAANAQNAAWAGTVLHPLLGDDQSWRLVSAVEPLPPPAVPPAADNFDDYRNLFFAQTSYYGSLRSALLDSAYGVVTEVSLSELAPDVQTALEACWISDRLLSACSPLLSVALEGRAAGPGFAELAQVSDTRLDALVGGGPQPRVLAQLQSGWTGRPVLPLADAGSLGDNTVLIAAAYAFYQGIGNAGQSALTSVQSPDALLAQAVSTTPDMEARQALEALSTFLVVGSNSPAPGPALAGLTSEYLVDRRDMLSARNRFDQALARYGPKPGTATKARRAKPGNAGASDRSLG